MRHSLESAVYLLFFGKPLLEIGDDCLVLVLGLVELLGAFFLVAE